MNFLEWLGRLMESTDRWFFDDGGIFLVIFITIIVQLVIA